MSPGGICREYEDQAMRRTASRAAVHNAVLCTDSVDWPNSRENENSAPWDWSTRSGSRPLGTGDRNCGERHRLPDRSRPGGCSTCQRRICTRHCRARTDSTESSVHNSLAFRPHSWIPRPYLHTLDNRPTPAARGVRSQGSEGNDRASPGGIPRRYRNSHECGRQSTRLPGRSQCERARDQRRDRLQGCQCDCNRVPDTTRDGELRISFRYAGSHHSCLGRYKPVTGNDRRLQWVRRSNPRSANTSMECHAAGNVSAICREIPHNYSTVGRSCEASEAPIADHLSLSNST